jgi:hypothetical protein
MPDGRPAGALVGLPSAKQPLRVANDLDWFEEVLTAEVVHRDHIGHRAKPDLAWGQPTRRTRQRSVTTRWLRPRLALWPPLGPGTSGARRRCEATDESRDPTEFHPTSATGNGARRRRRYRRSNSCTVGATVRRLLRGLCPRRWSLLSLDSRQRPAHAPSIVTPRFRAR